MEIRPRVLVLNERCRVFLELAEILTDSISVKKMSSESLVSFQPTLLSVRASDFCHIGITWIIIILIIISIMVTVSEVFIRFGILSTRQGRTPAGTLQSQSQACICMPRSFR